MLAIASRRVLPSLARRSACSCLELAEAIAPLQHAATMSTFTARGKLSDRILDWAAHYIFEPAVRLTLTSAGCILVLGVFLTVANTMLFFFNRATGSRFPTLLDFMPKALKRRPVQLTRVKLQLGYTTSVGLQLLVVADVLDTLVKPAFSYTLTELAKLAMIAGIRTVLAVFLAAEVREAEEELENQDESNITI